jgi:deoxyhypusine synthase
MNVLANCANYHSAPHSVSFTQTATGLSLADLMKKARLRPADAKTFPLKTLARKVVRADLARPLAAGSSVRDFLESLPNVLAAHDLRDLAQRIAEARRGRRTVLLQMGAHPLKVGLGPIICDLIRDGIITAIAANGATLIHDFELAYAGCTSEDVGVGLADGSFGMAEETGRILNEFAKIAHQEGAGLGAIAGREIRSRGFKFSATSILAAAHEADIPATIHVAVGADIIHMHPTADGAAIGAATMADFHRLVDVVASLSRGVVINLGSAVIMPEVFLKALNLARNLGGKVQGFTAADMDFARHYRPSMNVVARPTQHGGHGIMLTGHHEIMLPLLAVAVREKLAR